MLELIAWVYENDNFINFKPGEIPIQETSVKCVWLEEIRNSIEEKPKTTACTQGGSPQVF